MSATTTTTSTSTSIAPDEAWRRFDQWKRTRRKIGVILYGASGMCVYTIGVIEAARKGQLLLKGQSVRATFQLGLAKFSYGPVPTWPRWPNPPIVEVSAVQAQLENGDYLILAEGLRPESLPQRALPE